SNPNLHEVIAYCPQFNPLHTHLTGFETLQLYARIRGYPESTISSVADRLIDQLCLRPHAKKPVYAYSGGNLRKLSIAVAIIGHPKVLLLDEPTAGMDPGAKRCLWDVIKALLRENRSVVLTSHSMEECEALCNRLAIMMEGQFQCFGTAPHLKELFGEGYIVEVDLVHEEHDPQSLFASHAGIKLTDVVGRRCNFETHKEVPLSEVFKQLVALRTAGRIMNFAVRQSSLDSVFVNFVRRYENDKANEEYYGSEDLSFTEQEETFVKL
uniref:ABC transporter domain-containing protein n=1 Tax=Mesocestoides corti TaxID=53468 RepID=A0A5K3G5A6_MESCO